MKVYDIELSYDREAGNTATMRCPNCGDEVVVSDYGWWSTVCACGFKWHLVAYVYTDDDEED